MTNDVLPGYLRRGEIDTKLIEEFINDRTLLSVDTPTRNASIMCYDR